MRGRKVDTWIPADAHHRIRFLINREVASAQVIYIQTVSAAKRAAAEKIGAQLATNGHFSDEKVDYVK